ncbi:MAG: T9SS type A sorting domain-containing protein [Phaeodactylibacter sp.]|uniref:T9SS type A sorting domain-containing protein n=1 Tax=Phaeodactylibacter sp. TaxID=1940289 RepID=UPI0032ECABB9
MKKINSLLFILALVLTAVSVRAQDETLYLDAQFEVEVTSDVIYGVNATIMPVIAQMSNEALPRPLLMDVYQPVDAPGDRPVMLVFHTGNFLPFPANNGTGGTKTDSTVVELCNRLAARGYVAAAIDYRKGWNPVDPSQDFRKFFLINAAYRGVQDARTAVRFMRKLAVDGDSEGNVNPFQIDQEKVGIWGVGTGGYIVAATATLDEYMEVVIPKFLIDLDGPGPNNPVPMVIEAINGNIYGTSVGMVPPGYPVLPAGDTLCMPNHVTYANGDEISSDISFAVNNGGALGDISWIDENTPPWVSFHVPTDPFAPYTTGTLRVPGTGDPDDPSDDFAVVEVSGSYDIQARMNELGNNDLFDAVNNPGVEDFEEVANARNDGHKGLFPFPTGDVLDSAPWDFYAEDNINAMEPPMPERARMYWDTILAYVGPRACIAMNLASCIEVSTNNISPTEIGVNAAPNPASSEVLISVAPEHTIKTMELYNASGQLVQTYLDINNSQHTVYRKALPSGTYYLKLRLKEGFSFQKLIFK